MVKKSTLLLLFLLAAALAFSACGTANSPLAAQSPAIAPDYPGITASQAGEIAVEVVGGGSMQGIETTTVNGEMRFAVRVGYNGNAYDVVLDAQSGELISLRLIEQQPEQVMTPDTSQTAAEEAVPAVQNEPAAELPSAQTPQSPLQAAPPSPSPGSRLDNRPSNPTISLERAIEIGYAEITRQGHTGTFLRDSGIDWERGQWVWELLFRVEGGRLPLVEIYINTETGDIVKFEWDD